MPKGTRVERCYTKLKGKRGKGSAAAICQSSTGQSLATGKKLKGVHNPMQGAVLIDRDLCGVNPLSQQFEPTTSEPINQHKRMAGVS